MKFFPTLNILISSYAYIFYSYQKRKISASDL